MRLAHPAQSRTPETRQPMRRILADDRHVRGMNAGGRGEARRPAASQPGPIGVEVVDVRQLSGVEAPRLGRDTTPTHPFSRRSTPSVLRR